VSWFLTNRKRVVAGPLVPPGGWRPSRRIARTFPSLSKLLGEAFTSEIAVDGDDYVLFSWEGRDGVSSWLARPPCPAPGASLFPLHRALLMEFGGIMERANESEPTWLLNTNESLTETESRRDASFLSDYAWAFESVPGGIPIVLTDHYSISAEANGNTTLCHRKSGEVLLFAPDHSFKDVVPMETCPPYTLYRRKNGRTFVDWVETMARQWARALSRPPSRRRRAGR